MKVNEITDSEELSFTCLDRTYKVDKKTFRHFLDHALKHYQDFEKIIGKGTGVIIKEDPGTNKSALYHIHKKQQSDIILSCAFFDNSNSYATKWYLANEIRKASPLLGPVYGLMFIRIDRESYTYLTNWQKKDDNPSQSLVEIEDTDFKPKLCSTPIKK